jgi:hypothetical protein
MKQVAPLRYNMIFKKAFSQPDVFTALVKDFTGIELEIDEVENDKSFYPAVANVANRFDLFAEDKKNRVIVEVQHAHYPDTYERFLYYQLSAMVEYKKTPSPNSSILSRKFNVMEDFKGTEFNLFGREHQMLFIYTSSYGHGDLPEEIEEWMKAIDNSLTGTIYEEDYTNPQIQRIFELIEMDNLTPEENARLKDEYYPEKSLREAAQAQVEDAQEKIARNLKALGTLTDEQIANAIGLSLEEVKAL